ncbi:hypothetical protein M0R04_13220 [Candidatus Dojkabacteria bacterium]|nr:hypothetical protein [Candidatus Dojkabacteria bacterium]
MIDSLGIQHKTYKDYLEQARGQSESVKRFLDGKWDEREKFTLEDRNKIYKEEQ